MFNKKQLTSAAAFALCALTAGASAITPTNFFTPFDPNLRMPDVENETFTVGMNFEYGATSRGRNLDSKKANVLQLYNTTEAVIPMLMAPTATLTAAHSEAGTLLNSWSSALTSATDDGTRGHIAFTGKFEQIDATLWAGYKIPWDLGAGKFAINAYLPLRKAEIKDVRFTDLTKSLNNADSAVHAGLTDNLASRLTALGDLNIADVSNSGAGDLVVMLNWSNEYEQNKETLKNVGLFAKIGLSIPTGAEKKVDQAFSCALGNDGAWGMPIGLGIALDYDWHIRLGADVDFVVLFDNTKTRRLKTEEHQTDFLLLNKGRATLDHGLTWKFNLHAQVFRFWRGLSTNVAYEYIKHDDDRLTAKSDEFSSQIINTAKSLKEWNAHAFIFALNYDFTHECEKSGIIPQASIFYKLPIAGKGIMNPDTFGGQFSLNF